MHNSRLYGLVGVGIATVGLFMKGLRTAGEGLLPTLSQTSAGFPDGIPTIWGGAALWQQILLIGLAGYVVVTVLRPAHGFPLERNEAAITAVAGLALLGFAVAEWIRAIDQADVLEVGFLAAAQAGIINVAYSVSASPGFVILLVGTALVVYAGVLSLRREPIGSYL